jgi:hypothetical protein
MITISAECRRELLQFYEWLLVHAYGRRAAKTAKTIAAETNWSDRDLRAFAAAAVDEGLLICADSVGYFIPARRQEVEATVQRLRSQAGEMYVRANRLDALAGQRFATHLLDAAGL